MRRILAALVLSSAAMAAAPHDEIASLLNDFLAKVDDIATYEEPRQYPKGIEYVVVNGKLAVDGGHQTEARAGHMLHRSE